MAAVSVDRGMMMADYFALGTAISPFRLGIGDCGVCIVDEKKLISSGAETASSRPCGQPAGETLPATSLQ